MENNKGFIDYLTQANISITKGFDKIYKLEFVDSDFDNLTQFEKYFNDSYFQEEVELSLLNCKLDKLCYLEKLYSHLIKVTIESNLSEIAVQEINKLEKLKTLDIVEPKRIEHFQYLTCC